jgi:hypothetical protein
LLVRLGKGLRIIEPTRPEKATALESSAGSPRWSPDGKLIRMFDNAVGLGSWDSSTGKKLGNIPSKEIGNALEALISPAGRHLLVRPTKMGGSYEVLVGEVWDLDRQVRTATLRYQMKKETPWMLMKAEVALGWSADGRRLAVGGFDQSVYLFDLESGAIALTIPGVWKGEKGNPVAPRAPEGYEEVVNVRLAPDGGRVATFSIRHLDRSLHVGQDGDDRIPLKVRIRDAGTGELLAVVDGLKGKVRSAEFSPDGRLLLIVAGDAVARLFDAATGEEHVSYNVAKRRVGQARFSADGRWVLTLSEPWWAVVARGGRAPEQPDHDDVRLWPVDVAAEARRWQVRDFTPSERQQFEIEESQPR